MTKYLSSSNGKNCSGRRRGLQKGIHPNVKSEIVAGKFIVKGVVQDDGSGLSTAEPERPHGQTAKVTASPQVLLQSRFACKKEEDVSDEAIKAANPLDVVRLEIVVGNSRNSTVTALRHWRVKTLKKQIKAVYDKASDAFSRRVVVPGAELAITHLLANFPPLEDEQQLKDLSEGWEDQIYEAVPRRTQ